MATVEMNPQTIALIEEHGRAKTERARADIERRLWELAGPDTRKPFTELNKEKGRSPAAMYACSLLPEEAKRPHVVAYRRALSMQGSWVDPLWRCVDDERMPLSTALRLMREASKRSRADKSPLPFALGDVLKEYNELPAVQADEHGQVFRKRTPSSLNRKPPPEAAKPAAQKKVWAEVRRVLSDHLAHKLRAADPYVAERLWKDFEGELRQLVDTMQARIQRARRTSGMRTSAEPVTRKQVELACAALAMDAPDPCAPVDMQLARRHQRNMARRYHPDTHGGDERLRPQYQAVMEAFDTLELYNEQLGKPKLSVIDGGKGPQSDDDSSNQEEEGANHGSEYSNDRAEG